MQRDGFWQCDFDRDFLLLVTAHTALAFTLPRTFHRGQRALTITVITQGRSNGQLTSATLGVTAAASTTSAALIPAITVVAIIAATLTASATRTRRRFNISLAWRRRSTTRLAFATALRPTRFRFFRRLLFGFRFSFLLSFFVSLTARFGFFALFGLLLLRRLLLLQRFVAGVLLGLLFFTGLFRLLALHQHFLALHQFFDRNAELGRCRFELRRCGFAACAFCRGFATTTGFVLRPDGTAFFSFDNNLLRPSMAKRLLHRAGAPSTRNRERLPPSCLTFIFRIAHAYPGV